MDKTILVVIGLLLFKAKLDEFNIPLCNVQCNEISQGCKDRFASGFGNVSKLSTSGDSYRSVAAVKVSSCSSTYVSLEASLEPK